MQLFTSGASPFARKLRVQIHESGLTGRVETIDLSGSGLSPTAPVERLNEQNPLGKLPALVLDDGTSLYDSRVVAEYLDTLHEGAKLLPAAGPARFEVLRRVALADGICDAAVLGRYEAVLRPETLRWPAWLEAQLDKIRRSVDALARESLPAAADLGTIAVAVALGYLDLRWADADLWRSAHPSLLGWYDAFAMRASMRATEPTV